MPEQSLSKITNPLFVFLGQFKRKHKDQGKNLFTPQQKLLVEDSILKLNNILKKSQKESLPLSKYEMFDELKNWYKGLPTIWVFHDEKSISCYQSQILAVKKNIFGIDV